MRVCVWVTISLWLIFWVNIVWCTLSQLVDLFCSSLPVVFSIWVFHVKILSPILCLILIQILILSKPDLNNSFSRALIIGWLLSENLILRNLIARSTLVYGEFRYCPFFHWMVWWPFKVHDRPSWNLIQGGVYRNLSQISVRCLEAIKLFFMKIVAWHSRLKLCGWISSILWKLYYFYVFGWKSFLFLKMILGA